MGEWGGGRSAAKLREGGQKEVNNSSAPLQEPSAPQVHCQPDVNREGGRRQNRSSRERGRASLPFEERTRRGGDVSSEKAASLGSQKTASLRLKSNRSVLTRNTPEGRRAVPHLHSSSVRGLRLIRLLLIIHPSVPDLEITITTEDQVIPIRRDREARIGWRGNGVRPPSVLSGDLTWPI